MRLSSSRRLTGPSVWLPAPGVVATVELSPGDVDPEPGWREALERARNRLGFPDLVTVRRFQGGMTAGFVAPIDVLLAATHLNDWALTGGTAADLEALVSRIAAEAHPGLRAAVAEAERAGVPWLLDRAELTLGLGHRAITIPTDPPGAATPGGAPGSPAPDRKSAPSLDAIPWAEVGSIPVVMVTGTNGKTTTTRLLARMAQLAGHCVGMTCSDGVWIGPEQVETGDWTGPDGARRALRHRTVTLAVLETARGGVRRRGLALGRVDVAVVTNVSSDHLGAYGIVTLADLAEVKLTVARAARHAVLNADDPWLGGQSADSWFSLTRRVPGAFLVDDALMCGPLRVPVAAIPMTLGGAARYHVANALAAAAAALALGLSERAIEEGLRSFQPDATDNPGRTNLVQCQGVLVLLDYAHNPDAIARTMEVVRNLPARRRLISIGLPGDRSDDALAACARALLAAAPERVVLRDPFPSQYLRGRLQGEVPAVLAEALRSAGYPAEAIGFATDEVGALEQAFAWVEPGDLVAIMPHAQRQAVSAWIEARSSGVKVRVESP